MCIIRTAGPIRQKLLHIPGTNASVLLVRLGAKVQELVKDFVGILWETCCEAVHRSKLGRVLDFLVIVATIILVSITSDKNNYSHFIITLFMLFYKQQMPRI